MGEGRSLPPEVLGLLRHVVTALDVEEATAILAQADSATVVRASATMIDVETSAGTPTATLPDGPIPLEVLVVTADEPTGEILVWMRGGRLAGLEQAWWTDDPPLTWPPPEQVRIG